MSWFGCVVYITGLCTSSRSAGTTGTTGTVSLVRLGNDCGQDRNTAEIWWNENDDNGCGLAKSQDVYDVMALAFFVAFYSHRSTDSLYCTGPLSRIMTLQRGIMNVCGRTSHVNCPFFVPAKILSLSLLPHVFRRSFLPFSPLFCFIRKIPWQSFLHFVQR